MPKSERLLAAAQTAAVCAGDAILACGRPPETGTVTGSGPQTLADRRAHDVLVAQLSAVSPHLPIASEEGDRQVTADRYWLVDPLDGTKEYLAGNGEYTVNIALIEEGYPVLGVLYVPAAHRLYWAACGLGAWRRQAQKTERLPVQQGGIIPRALVSRSHSSSAMAQALDALQTRGAAVQTLGSSWKFAQVAEGAADLYVRLSPTYAWDTAAGQCLLEQRGGRVADAAGRLRYGQSDALSPGFLAAGTPALWSDWAEALGLDATAHVPEVS